MGDQQPISAPRFVGQSIGRKENKRFLTGRGRYVDDFVEAGMLHAAILRSPVARGKILSIDTADAAALPGVWGAYTAKELNHLFQPLKSTFSAKVSQAISVVLADTDVCYVGEPVAIVVAEDRYIAEDALDLIDVEYEPMDAIATISAARDGAPCLPGKDNNIGAQMDVALPGCEEAFAAAAHVVSAKIAQGRVSPAPMETRGIIANPIMDGKLEVRLSSQVPHIAKAYLAHMLDIPENHIRVISPDIGGAFGQKFAVARDFLATIGAALILRRPVKYIEDRAENLQVAGHGRAEALELDLAFDANGRMTATRFTVEDNCGADSVSPPGSATGLMAVAHTGAYAIPTVTIKTRDYYTNICGSTPYRGPWAGETLIREITVDKAARQLGIDPVELRRRNIITQWPHTMPLGQQLDRVTPRETLDTAIEMLGYEAFREEQRAARAAGRHIGVGMALCIEPTAISGPNSTDSAEVRLESTGRITATMTCHSQGHSVETTMAQIVADEMGVDVDHVAVVFGDTDVIGFGSGAGGSRQAVVAGGAAKIAGSMLREKILTRAARFLQTSADQLTIRDGQVVASGPGAASITLGALTQASDADPAGEPEGFEGSMSARYTYQPPMFTFSNACHVSTVEVDIETGLVKVLRYIVAEDCGVMLNPAVVEGQVSGGVVQALGNILWEEQHYDDDGNPSAGTFKDYAMPLMTDVPTIEFGHLCTPSDTPTGAKGVGEGGAIVGAPCVYNAIADALSSWDVRLEQLPLTPARILAALGEAKERG